jgi:Asp-tRNA(Asn)/Glu-tRNA(Gln) amidotransferase A subunit family amidase
VQIRPPRIGQEKVIVDSEEVDVVVGCTRFTRLANSTGIPAIVLPCGKSSDSLPLSVQFMAPKLGEIELLKLAYAFEKASPELRTRYELKK